MFRLINLDKVLEFILIDIDCIDQSVEIDNTHIFLIDFCWLLMIVIKPSVFFISCV